MYSLRPAVLILLFGLALSAQPLDLVFALETTPGTERATGLIRARDLGDQDRAGIVAFHRSSKLALALTDDKKLLDQKLEDVGARVGVTLGVNDGAPLNRSFIVDLGDTIEDAAGELATSSQDRKRAILVFYAAEDPSLSARMDAIEAMLETSRIRLFAVLVYRTDMTGPPGMPSITRPSQRRHPEPIQTPVVTTQLLSKLAKRSGGKVFQTNWRMGKILDLARR